MLTIVESNEPIVLKHTVSRPIDIPGGIKLEHTTSSPISIPGAYNTENIRKEFNTALEGLKRTEPTDPMHPWNENHLTHALFLHYERQRDEETMFAWYVFTH